MILPINQRLTFYIHFHYHIWHSRKVLLLLEFVFANPENSNFKKNPYLDCVQIGISLRLLSGKFAYQYDYF